MNIPNIAGILNVGKSFVMANRPELLLGMSVTGTVMSIVAAARGGYKSGQQVMEAEIEAGEALTLKEKAQLTWINYLPAAAGGLGAISATSGLHIVHVKEKKMLAAACLMAIDEVKKEAGNYEKSLKDLGFTMSTDEKELEKVADSDGVAKHIDGEGVIEELYLVRDKRTQRDIWSNKRKIDDAVNEVNDFINREGEASLNLFYTYAGFNDVPDGLDVGWTGGTKLAIGWDTEVRDDGRPVRQFTFRPQPKAGLVTG